MAIINAIVLVLQLAAPLLLLIWIWRGGDRWTLAAKGAITALYLLLIALAGLWMFLPSWLIWVYAAGAGVSAALSLRRPASTRTPLGRRAVHAIAIVALIAANVYAAAGRRAPEDAIDLHPPLLDGRYYVVSGGANALVNLHFETMDIPAYRGQSHAVDLVALNRFGVRSKRLLPRAPSDYEIFGAPLYAPCSGVVTQTENSRPDMTPPAVDAEQMPGNHVVLNCDGVLILMAHLQHGSVRVRTGDAVHAAQLIGNVGNSGNSGEPHLHIHAQRPSTNESLYGGEPLPIRFAGRYLARNDRL